MEEEFPRLKAAKWEKRMKPKPKAPTETFKRYEEAVGNKATTGIEETPISSWAQVASTRSKNKEKKKATTFINSKSVKEFPNIDNKQKIKKSKDKKEAKKDKEDDKKIEVLEEKLAEANTKLATSKSAVEKKLADTRKELAESKKKVKELEQKLAALTQKVESLCD
jgi:chromosome segregation ATPase